MSTYILSVVGNYIKLKKDGIRYRSTHVSLVQTISTGTKVLLYGLSQSSGDYIAIDPAADAITLAATAYGVGGSAITADNFEDAVLAAFPDTNSGSGGSGTATLYSTTGSNTDGAMTQAATTLALGSKLGLEQAGTYATISTIRTDTRIVIVAVDETAANATNQVYLFNGQTKIGQLLTY